MFVTLFGMQFDLEAGTACYCGAGHPPALLRRGASSEVVHLESAHLPIGVAANVFLGEPMKNVELAPGDIIWLYTDGLMELRSSGREILGIAGLAQRVKDFDTGPLRPGLAERFLGSVLADFESPEDDITLVVAAIK
jgi:sigma-B regulation protein RsbU (phosphoserine phosphatase)